MLAKLTLAKNFGVKTSTGISMDHGGNQSNGTRNMKNVNFVPNTSKKTIIT